MGHAGVEIHTFSFNEELMVPHFFNWYGQKFPGAHIVVHDNESDDATPSLVESLGGEVRTWSTGGVSAEDALIRMKNEVWKEVQETWVIVCDMDEFLDVDESFLMTTRMDVIRGRGYDMVGSSGLPKAIRTGIRSTLLDKFCAWRVDALREMAMSIGGHDARPVPKDPLRPLLIGRRNLFHYKWISIDYVVDRFALLNDRRSELGRTMGWGRHYEADRDEIVKRWQSMADRAEIVW